MITVFGETLKWDTNALQKGFDEIFEFTKYLEQTTRNKKLSKGFVYSLLNIWDSTFSKSIDIFNETKWNQDVQNRLSSKAFIPLFKYKLRLINDKKVKDEIDKKGIKFIPWIRVPVSWTSLRLR